MTRIEIRGQLKRLKGRARQWWGKATGDEYHMILGTWETMMGTSQTIYGRLRARIVRARNRIKKV